MLNFRRLILTIAAGGLALPVSAAAQGASDVPGFDNSLAQLQEHLPGNRFKLTGAVELSQVDMKFYADEVEYFGDTNRLVATGNVLLIEKDHQIAAERADFNAQRNWAPSTTRAGSPHSARRPMPAPSVQPCVQCFWGTRDKTRLDTYVITNGGFTTCAQANPRWEMTSGSLKLRIDHYAFLRHMLLKVKSVPVLYLPALYYPISKDNRSTGFLMPSYGSSSIQGQILSNAFFWAMNRSRDLTIQHDWYSRTGQQIAGEYRYVALLGGGNLRSTLLKEHPTIVVDPVTGAETTVVGRRNFSLNGSLSQGVGRGWYVQGRTDYFSQLTVQQANSTDVSNASDHTRAIGGSVTGTVARLRLTGTYDRAENFIASQGRSGLRGHSPRINLSRPDRTIAGLPLYASVGADYVHLVQQGFNAQHVRDSKEDFDRLDVMPVIRFPFARLPYLSMNSSLMWRNTFWSDSYALLANGTRGPRVDAPISRRFFQMTADFTGPTLVRIFDAPPDSTYAQRFKHTIEPFLQIMHLTAIDDFDKFIKFEYVDALVGDATSRVQLNAAGVHSAAPPSLPRGSSGHHRPTARRRLTRNDPMPERHTNDPITFLTFSSPSGRRQTECWRWEPVTTVTAGSNPSVRRACNKTIVGRLERGSSSERRRWAVAGRPTTGSTPRCAGRTIGIIHSQLRCRAGRSCSSGLRAITTRNAAASPPSTR